MQRLFPMFPAGSPGIGLVILRLSVATVLAAQLLSVDPVAPTWLVLGAALMSSVGLFTPVVAVLCVLLGTAQLTSAPFELVTALAVGNACAVALLGPGAYSIDALRYGRRVL